MISIEDAADTLLPEFLLDKDPGYDGWLFGKVSATLARVDAKEARLHDHDHGSPRSITSSRQILMMVSL